MSNEEEEYSDDDSGSGDTEELVHEYDQVSSLSREATSLRGTYGEIWKIRANLCFIV